MRMKIVLKQTNKQKKQQKKKKKKKKKKTKKKKNKQNNIIAMRMKIVLKLCFENYISWLLLTYGYLLMYELLPLNINFMEKGAK